LTGQYAVMDLSPSLATRSLVAWRTRRRTGGEAANRILGQRLYSLGRGTTRLRIGLTQRRTNQIWFRSRLRPPPRGRPRKFSPS